MPDTPANGRHDPLAAFLAPLDDAGAISVAVMVASVDGRATVAGRVGQLTGGADQRVLLHLRERAGAVVIGAATKRAEGYAQLLDDAARTRRAACGLTPEPELVVLSRSGPALSDVWASLRTRHQALPIVSEGGPTVLGAELEAGLIDQLVLCVSPQLIGDDSQKRIVEVAAPLGRDLQLLAHAAADGYVFLRYAIN